MDNKTHRPNRQVTDDEKKLWNAIREAHHTKDYSTVNSTEVGRSVGLHETRTRQIVATWANEGLVQPTDHGNRLFITELGEQKEHIESGMTSGESWR